MDFCKKLLFSCLSAGVFAFPGLAAEGEAVVLGQVQSKTYLKECGACHFAYQPQFLPKRSWEKLLVTLDSHFGDSATLDEATRKEILAYTTANSADSTALSLSRKMVASLRRDEVPIRISDTPFFKRNHREISAAVFKRKSIGSPSNCLGCHTTAEKGDFSEDRVKIPKN